MIKIKGLFGGTALILVGMSLIFPQIFSVVSKYFLTFIGVYLIILGIKMLLFSNHTSSCGFYRKDSE